MLPCLSQPEDAGTGCRDGHRLNDCLPLSVIPSCTVVPKSIAQLNDEAVTAFGMQALMEAENIFGKSGSSRSARNHLAFLSIALVDLIVAAPLVERNDMLPSLLDVGPADVYVGAIGKSHIRQVEEERQTAVTVYVVVEALR